MLSVRRVLVKTMSDQQASQLNGRLRLMSKTWLIVPSVPPAAVGKILRWNGVGHFMLVRVGVTRLLTPRPGEKFTFFKKLWLRLRKSRSRT